MTLFSLSDRVLKNSLKETITRLEQELAVWDADLALLHADIPGDPGVTRWPPYLEAIVEIAEESRALCARHLELCRKVLKEWDTFTADEGETMTPQQRMFPGRASGGTLAVIVPGNRPLPRHDLTFRLTQEQTAQGYNAKCNKCGKIFRSILDADAQDCT